MNQLSPEVIEAAAEAVHVAWMKEKRRQGFTDHPLSDGNRGRCCKTVDAKWHHDDMRPYAELDERTKEYDRVTARAALEASPLERYREALEKIRDHDGPWVHAPRAIAERALTQPSEET